MADPLGVSLAFGQGPLTVTPTWTRIDTLAGCRVQSWDISRGRPDEFSKTTTGTARVRIADLEGLFDPTNGASTYFPDVVPDIPAALALFDPVQETWHTVFRGHVESWSFDVASYTYASGVVVHGVLFVTLELVDGFAWLADHELQPGDGDLPTPVGSEGRVFYEETTGVNAVKTRIDAILVDVGWPSGLSDIFTGNVQLCDTVYEPGTSALAAVFDAADGEFPGVANVYMSKNGILTFHGRQPRFRPDVAEYGINRRDVGDPSVTETDDTVAPISELSFTLGKDQLYNSVLCTPQEVEAEQTTAVVPTEADIAGQLVEDATSITAHGKKGLTFTDLLTIKGNATGNNGLEETKLFATYYRDNYKDPIPRISRMVFKSKMPDHRLADPLWKMICRAEISDLLTVVTVHKGGGGFGDAPNDQYYVEGIRYTCRPANDQVHMVTLEVDVSPKALFDDNPFDADDFPS